MNRIWELRDQDRNKYKPELVRAKGDSLYIPVLSNLVAVSVADEVPLDNLEDSRCCIPKESNSGMNVHTIL